MRTKMMDEIIKESTTGVEDGYYNEETGRQWKSLEIHSDNYQVYIRIDWLEDSCSPESEEVEVFDKDGKSIKITKEEKETLLCLLD